MTRHAMQPESLEAYDNHNKAQNLLRSFFLMRDSCGATTDECIAFFGSTPYGTINGARFALWREAEILETNYQRRTRFGAWARIYIHSNFVFQPLPKDRFCLRRNRSLKLEP